MLVAGGVDADRCDEGHVPVPYVDMA